MTDDSAAAPNRITDKGFDERRIAVIVADGPVADESLNTLQFGAFIEWRIRTGPSAQMPAPIAVKPR